MDADNIERFAIKAALGNNGGSWSIHYTENQKNFWRSFIKELVHEMKECK